MRITPGLVIGLLSALVAGEAMNILVPEPAALRLVLCAVAGYLCGKFSFLIFDRRS